MDNQHKNFPIGRMVNVEDILVGVKAIVDFKVTKIMVEKGPYLSLVGIEWAFDNYVINDLQK